MASLLDRDLAPGDILQQRYQIVSLLGRGGMGTVYRARTQQGHEVALKTLRLTPQDAADESVKRFWREARATSTLQHPNLVRMLDAGADDGMPFLVMELLDGMDLSSAIQQEGPLDPALTARIFVFACRGLAALHAQGIIHRDLKPSNLFLHRGPGDSLIPKLCDLGIAKLNTDGSATTDLTGTGAILGSPHYMSPEQVQDSKRVDLRTDLWSMCMALYEALSGRKRWGACTHLGDIFVSICTQDTPRLADDAPWVPPALCKVVHRGLERDRDARYASADELAAALEPFAAPESALLASRLHALSDTPAMANARRVWPPLQSYAEKRGRVELSPRPSKSRRGLLFLLGGTTLSLSGLALWWIHNRFTAAPWAAEIARARLAILPPTALVFVDDLPVPVQDGFAWIQGPVGEPIRVVARHGNLVSEQIVRIARGGQISPSRFDVVAVARARAPQPRAGTAAPTAPTAAVTTPTPATAVPTATAAATPKAAETAAPPPTTAGPIRIGPPATTSTLPP